VNFIIMLKLINYYLNKEFLKVKNENFNHIELKIHIAIVKLKQ